MTLFYVHKIFRGNSKGDTLDARCYLQYGIPAAEWICPTACTQPPTGWMIYSLPKTRDWVTEPSRSRAQKSMFDRDIVVGKFWCDHYV